MAKINKINPDNQAEDDHTTFRRFDGKIQSMRHYVKNHLNPKGFDEIKRLDSE